MVKRTGKRNCDKIPGSRDDGGTRRNSGHAPDSMCLPKRPCLPLLFSGPWLVQWDNVNIRDTVSRSEFKTATASLHYSLGLKKGWGVSRALYIATKIVAGPSHSPKLHRAPWEPDVDMSQFTGRLVEPSVWHASFLYGLRRIFAGVCRANKLIAPGPYVFVASQAPAGVKFLVSAIRLPRGYPSVQFKSDCQGGPAKARYNTASIWCMERASNLFLTNWGDPLRISLRTRKSTWRTWTEQESTLSAISNLNGEHLTLPTTPSLKPAQPYHHKCYLTLTSETKNENTRVSINICPSLISLPTGQPHKWGEWSFVVFNIFNPTLQPRLRWV